MRISVILQMDYRAMFEDMKLRMQEKGNDLPCSYAAICCIGFCKLRIS